MDDRKLDELLGKLAAHQGQLTVSTPDFRNRLWQHIEFMSDRRGRRRMILSGIAIFLVGLGAGAGTGRKATSPPATNILMAGADLSPSQLLHIES